MKRWVLAALPFVITVIAYSAIASSAPSPESIARFGFGTRLVGLAGAIILALQFDRGDYLRRAWMLWVGSYVVLIVNALVFGSPSRGAPATSTTQALLSGSLVVIANGALVIGTLMVARAWKAAGLTLTAARSTQIAVVAISLVVGLVVGGSALWANARSLVGGNYSSLAYTASSLGDIIRLAVLGPILLTAFTLRGSRLAWPWTMIVANSLGWLLYDATPTMAPLLGFSPDQRSWYEVSLRLFVALCVLSAGLLQAIAVRERSPEPAAAS